MKSVKVIDLELKENRGIKRKFNLVSVDFNKNQAVIQSKEYGFCSQDLDKLKIRKKDSKKFKKLFGKTKTS
jgi:hypothetical protein